MYFTRNIIAASQAVLVLARIVSATLTIYNW
jgi:hypothetical protein